MVPPGSGSDSNGKMNRPGGIRGNRPRLRGEVSPRPPLPAVVPPPLPAHAFQSTGVPKKRVLFVCIGNSCRSQMAEAFARAYGSDVLWVQSAGLSPASIVAPLTKQMLEERSLRFDDQFPKPLDVLQREKFDLLVNMSGHPVNFPSTERVDWKVKDPIGQTVETYRTVAKQIEELVMRLILDERNARR